MTNINSVLPTEIFVRVFENLPFAARVNSLQVCKYWYTILKKIKIRQPPVNLVVTSNSSETREDTFLPKLGFEDGECANEEWETFHLKFDQVVKFLSTFCSGKRITLVVEEPYCLYQCLKLILVKWKYVEDVQVEYLDFSNEPCSFLRTCHPDLKAMVTSLKLPRTFLERSLPPISPFSKLKSLYLSKGRGVLDERVIRQLPDTLQVFWCKNFIFEENGLKRFLKRFGANLREFAALGLSQEDVNLLVRGCPKIHSLRLDHCTAKNAAELTSSLENFRRMKHFGLFNLVFLKDGIEYDRLFENWPHLESLYMPFPGRNGDLLMWFAQMCCPNLSAVHVNNRLSNHPSTNLTDMEPLRDQLTSIGVTIDDNTLPLLAECLEIFKKARHFDLSPGQKSKKGLAMSVASTFAAHAAKFPKELFTVRWRELPSNDFPNKQKAGNLFFFFAP